MVRVLLVAGSLRRGSTNAAALAAMAEAALPGIEVESYEGLGHLPHFSPDDDVAPLPGSVTALRTAIGGSDAVLFCTPEYAGSLPGSFKNLLDWSVGGGEIYEKPVAWVNVSTSPLGGVGAHDTLRVVLGYVGAVIVEEACVHVPVGRNDLGPDGRITDPVLRDRLVDALRTLAAYSG